MSTDRAAAAANLFMQQPVPTFGPVFHEPAGVAGRAARNYPLWWWPPSAAAIGETVSLTMHAVHPLAGTVILGAASVVSGAGGLASAASPSDADKATGALFGAAGALAFEATGCHYGGLMSVALAGLGFLGCAATMMPKWLRVFAEERRHRHGIEQARMAHQYAYATRQLEAAGHAHRTAELATLAHGADDSLRRIERDLAAIAVGVDAVEPHIGRRELTPQAAAFLEQQAVERDRMLDGR